MYIRDNWFLEAHRLPSALPLENRWPFGTWIVCWLIFEHIFAQSLGYCVYIVTWPFSIHVLLLNIFYNVHTSIRTVCFSLTEMLEMLYRLSTEIPLHPYFWLDTGKMHLLWNVWSKSFYFDLSLMLNKSVYSNIYKGKCCLSKPMF